MNLTDDNIAHCEECGCAMDVTVMQPYTNVECPECGRHNRVKVDVGSYVLKKRQGVGGMSLVFGAVDKTLGREVAIKILNENYSMDAKRIEQFEQEAKITAAISHPHVVRVYTVGQAFQRFFIAMELVPGGSLEQKMHDIGALPEADILRWGREVCEGLNAANNAGLIHRDIKPGNILFDSEGHVKIVDFGLALVTQGGKAQADEIWATPYYVPPETLDVLEEDFRSDIYALGASLFHALSGKPPFDTETRSTSELKKLKMDLPSLKDFAPRLRDETCAVIDKAMAFAMEDRFSSYKEMIDELHHAEMMLENGEEQPALSTTQRDERRERSSRVKLYGMVAVGVLAIGGVIAALTLGGDGKTDGLEELEPVVMQGLEGSDDGGAAGRRLAAGIRQGREALHSKKFRKAAIKYGGIARDNRFTINSVMWGGLQSSIVNWLDGDSGAAKFDLRLLLERYEEAERKNKVKEPNEITKGLVKAIPLLLKMEKIPADEMGKIKSEGQAMLVYASALKNWEEGYANDALSLLDMVSEYVSEVGGEVSEELKVYVSMIPDFKSDADLMEPFKENFFPATDEEVSARREVLSVAQEKLKTKGRAVENFAEWLVQLDIHGRRLALEQESVVDDETADEPDDDDDVEEDIKNQSEWSVFLLELEGDLEASRFLLASEKLKLKSFEDEGSKMKKEQMIYLCDKASGYLGTLSETLSKGVVSAPIKLKNGKEFRSFRSIGVKGFMLDDVDGRRDVGWGEVETESVIDLVKISLSDNDLSQFEKDFRIEQAIAYAWLGGEKEKAKLAASGLAQVNAQFKDRWSACMKALGGE